MVEEEILWNYLSYMILIFEETGNGQVVQHELDMNEQKKIQCVTTIGLTHN